MRAITFREPAMLPSAFQVIERPLYWLNGQINENARSWLSSDRVEKLEHTIEAYSALAWEAFKNFDLKETSRCLCTTAQAIKERYATWPRFTAVLAGTAIVAPVVIVCTPVTIVADLVAGAAEAAFAKRQGFSEEKVRLILQKKWIASPLQQATFVGSNLLATTVIVFLATWGYTANNQQLPPMRDIPRLYLVGMGFGVYFYRETQKFIGSSSFPSWAKPENFNIFIGGGAPDIDGKLFTDQAEKEYQEYKKSQSYSPEQEYDSNESYQEKHDNTGYNYGTRGPSSQSGPSEEIPIIRVRTNFPDILTKIRAELEGKNAPAAESKLKAFYDLVVTTNPITPTAAQILGITESTQSAISEGFKKQSRIVHPDLNIPDERPIAQILFKALCAARNSLEDSFKMSK